MFNFNGIPIPKYTGGAHYTWQILNGSYESGCFFQEITSQIDRGDILRYQYAEIPKTARTPKDYFEVNNGYGLIFLKSLLDDMQSGVSFERISYDKFLSEGMYFPRLLTRENAYIDWQWSGMDIERFCNAFGDPYPGAATFCNGLEVRVRSAVFTSSSENLHPYTYGLILRKYNSRLWVSVHGGLLELASLMNAEGGEIISHFKEGDRFATPVDILWHSMNYSAKFNSLGAKSNGKPIKI
jgi:methionyl-tRNA formyltransferase